MNNKGIQAVVYEWVLQNPWRKRADACSEISKQWNVTSMQAYYAHINLTHKGRLQKRYGGANTVYAVKMSASLDGDDMYSLFSKWWREPEQAELRSSCAEGWGWKIWQASRVAIEVVMPPRFITTEIGPVISHEKMIARLAANGIKVKP